MVQLVASIAVSPGPWWTGRLAPIAQLAMLDNTTSQAWLVHNQHWPMLLHESAASCGPFVANVVAAVPVAGSRFTRLVTRAVILIIIHMTEATIKCPARNETGGDTGSGQSGRDKVLQCSLKGVGGTLDCYSCGHAFA